LVRFWFTEVLHVALLEPFQALTMILIRNPVPRINISFISLWSWPS
jgi:hypothetical protein